jgi:hypothetical protein
VSSAVWFGPGRFGSGTVAAVSALVDGESWLLGKAVI